MVLYHISYETENYYTRPVREAFIELMVLPETNKYQECISYKIENSLEANPHFSTSLFGAKLIRFKLPGKFCSFNIKVNSTVKRNFTDTSYSNGLLTCPQNVSLSDDNFRIDYFRYLSLNEFTSPQKSHIPKEALRYRDEDIFEYMKRANNWIFNYIKYEIGVTGTQTTIDEILDLKAGVCQDQAHLFIAVMRANKIPARYVSGYLSQGPSFNGNLAMHAWAEAYLPGAGWVGFDPSNNMLSNDNHIKVSHGLDYTDCMPIRGVVIAKGLGTTSYKVKIEEQQNQ